MLLRGVWERVKMFLVDAGTVILALTIVLWALLSYPKDPAVTAQADASRAALAAQDLGDEERERMLAEIGSRENGAQLRYSVAGRLGHLIEPALSPLGFDWRIGVGILGAFAAREVFVGTLGVVFDMADASETSEPLRETLRAATWPDGSPLFMVAYMTVLAYSASLLVYQVGRFFGWGLP